MTRKKRENIIIVVTAIAIIGFVIGYFYSSEQASEQAKIKGFVFGNDLQSIQEELKKLQTEFDSKFNIWKEGGTSAEEFLGFSEKHVKKMEKLVSRYDELSPPEAFESSVELFKLSTQSQLESDKQAIKWIKTGDESANVRSNFLLQEAFEYEMAALAKFNAAKAEFNP